MIIDAILDRYDAEARGDFDYNARDFYINVMLYGEAGYGITGAMDYGSEADVKSALIDYVLKNEYNKKIIDYIEARAWIKNTNEARPLVKILEA